MPTTNLNTLKICLVIDSLANGGAQRQIVNLAVGLKEKGHDIRLVTYAPYFHHLEKLIKAGIAHEHFEKKSKLDIRPIFALRKLISDNEIDGLIAFLRTPAIYSEMAAIAKPKLALLVSERGGVKPGGLQLFDLITGLLHIFSDAVISNSYAYNNSLSAKLPFLKKKSLTIHNGVENIFFEQGQRRIAAFIDSPQDSINVVKLCVVAARPTPEKGLIPLVKSVKLLYDKGYTNFRIDWIGPADDHYPLIREATEYLRQNNLTPYWQWLGPKAHIETHYKHYDAHILPSLHEGVANVLCEAMASGLPSVATRIADNSDIVIDNVSGILCEPDDSESLCKGLEKFLKMSQKEKQSMSIRAHEQALALFSMAEFINKWEAAIVSNSKNPAVMK